MTTAKSGYVITTTPGLIEEGSLALSSETIKRGEIGKVSTDPSCLANDVAVYKTREAAEAAMLKLVPDGQSPESYAGLSVEPAWEYLGCGVYADILACYMD